MKTDSTPSQALQALIGAGLFAVGVSILAGWGIAQVFDWIAGVGAGGVTLGVLIYLESRWELS